MSEKEKREAIEYRIKRYGTDSFKVMFENINKYFKKKEEDKNKNNRPCD